MGEFMTNKCSKICENMWRSLWKNDAFDAIIELDHDEKYEKKLSEIAKKLAESAKKCKVLTVKGLERSPAKSLQREQFKADLMMGVFEMQYENNKPLALTLVKARG